MTELAALISKYGLPTVAIAVLLYVLLRGEFKFQYPRSSEERIESDRRCGRRNSTGP